MFVMSASMPRMSKTHTHGWCQLVEVRSVTLVALVSCFATSPKITSRGGKGQFQTATTVGVQEFPRRTPSALQSVLTKLCGMIKCFCFGASCANPRYSVVRRGDIFQRDINNLFLLLKGGSWFVRAQMMSVCVCDCV